MELTPGLSHEWCTTEWLGRLLPMAYQEPTRHGLHCPNARKRRLFICACIRRLVPIYPGKPGAAKRFAGVLGYFEKAINGEAVRRDTLIYACSWAAQQAQNYEDSNTANYTLALRNAYRALCDLASYYNGPIDQEALFDTAMAANRAFCVINKTYTQPGLVESEKQLAGYLKDICGPFWTDKAFWTDKILWPQGGPPASGLPINDPEVIRLARAALLTRREDGTLEEDRLAVLADALEENGYAQPLLLEHLRGVCTWTRHLKIKVAPQWYEDRKRIAFWGLWIQPGSVTPQSTFSCRRDALKYAKKHHGLDLLSTTKPNTYEGEYTQTQSWPTGPHVYGCWALDYILGR